MNKGASASSIALIALVTITLTAAPSHRGTDESSQSGNVSAERASEPIVLAQRCFYYAGQLRCF